MNLYEPVLQNSVGAGPAGLGPGGTQRVPGRASAASGFAGAADASGTAAALEQAAARLWNTLDLGGAGGPGSTSASRRATLAPRLDVALTHHTLEGMFVTF